MEKLFEIHLLDEAFAYLKSLDRKHSEKILYNIRKAQTSRDSEPFKKLTDDIWEFRTLYQGNQYRLLAFWDKSGVKDTLVVSTHGFIKSGVKCLIMRFKEQFSFAPGILRRKRNHRKT